MNVARQWNWAASLSVLVLFVGALIGCSYDPPAAEHDGFAGPYPNVSAMDGLDSDIVFDQPIVQSATEDSPMVVNVPIRYLDDRGRAVQYRFLFLDARGTPVGPPMEWAYTVLPARVQTFLKGTSLSNQAVDWRLEIRKAR